MARKKFDHITYLTEQLQTIEAKELKERYYLINGWRIKYNRNGIYWHNANIKEFKGYITDKLGKYELKADKPYTRASMLNKKVIDYFIGQLGKWKTDKEERRLEREFKKVSQVRSTRFEKRAWCDGCPHSTGGEESLHCGNMKLNEEIGHFYCSEKKFYEWNWCYNAKLNDPPKDKPWATSFTCGKTGEPCPFQNNIMPNDRNYLSRNAKGEHYTSCIDYEGHRQENEIVIEKKGTPPPSKVKRKVIKTKTKKSGAPKKTKKKTTKKGKK